MLQPARLHFRDFSPADLFVVAHAMGDARLTAFYGLETAHSDARVIAQEQLDWYASVASEGSGWWQAVLLDGAVIAAVGIYDHDDEADSADLGYWLLPDHWGHGWMDQALRQWLPGAFGRLGLHSVVAYVEPENAASTRLLGRLGFCHEGLLRDCSKRDGAYISLQRYSLLVSELPDL
ncbi:GNAT family protein [Comamonas sp.]|uniref:GNAT family N-acetyltransferase n=1 Tax=Comamonas sp. TaxID=34028 RepID=UPI0028A67E37|nr:GNAT family protein [Comamonas sp.]